MFVSKCGFLFQSFYSLTHVCVGVLSERLTESWFMVLGINIKWEKRITSFIAHFYSLLENLVLMSPGLEYIKGRYE